MVDGSEDALARAVRGMLDEPASAAAMGRRGSRAARRTFSMSGVVDDLVEIYADCTNRHGKRKALGA